MSTLILGWFRRNLFPTVTQSIITLVLIALIVSIVSPFLKWGIFDAVWFAPNGDTCRKTSDGACWAVISHNFNFSLFGFYPAELRWRAWTALGLFIAGIIYSGRKKSWKPSLILVWVALVVISLVLLKGSIFGLEDVETNKWGGLILTAIIALTSIIISYPLGVLLALGRSNKNLPIIRGICSGFIELIRGVPFISLLFMASLMLPLFLPPGTNFPNLPRTIVAGIIFSAAYLAETVRGGLAAIPRGQIEAAESLGLSYWRRNVLVVLPQALSLVIQPTVGSFIALFIDTSLVVIISMYDFLGATRSVLSDFNWIGFGREVYVFCAFVYFAFCYTLSKYTRRLETEIVTKKQN